MTELAQIILKSGRAGVELALFVVLPVMVLMLSIMRLLEARGLMQKLARFATPVIRPLGVPGLGVFAILQLLFVSFAGPIATLATMDQRGTSDRHIAATLAMVFAMAQANVTYPMAAKGLNVGLLLAVSLVGGAIAAVSTYYLFARRFGNQEAGGAGELDESYHRLRNMNTYQILQSAGEEAVKIALGVIPMVVLALFVVNLLVWSGLIGWIDNLLAPMFSALDLPVSTALTIITKYIAGGTAMMGVFVELMESGQATIGDFNRLAGLLIHPLDLAGIAILISAGPRVAKVLTPALLGAFVGIGARTMLHLWLA